MKTNEDFVQENAVETEATDIQSVNTENADATKTQSPEGDAGTDGTDAPESKLPEGVTAEPRNEEEMHMDLIREWPNAVQVYLKVSDDAGEVLGSTVLERQVKECCNKYADPKTEVKDPAKDLASVKELATRYALQINMVESGLSGTITKYRIRQGTLFLIMKDLVKATEGPKWIEYFKKNFDPREFRSVQDYMRLAKVPGIIAYAVFGKERLLQILRQLSAADKATADPVGAFIERNQVIFKFDPKEEVDAQELRIEADIAINLQKLATLEIEGITKEMVETLVRNGRELESSHIRELTVAKETGAEAVVARFSEILASDGRVVPVMTPTRKAEGFKKTTDRFLKAMESALEDADYLSQVNAELITDLRAKLELLEQKIQPTT